MTLTRKRNIPRIEIRSEKMTQKIYNFISWITSWFDDKEEMAYKPSVHGLYGFNKGRRWTVPIYCGPPGTVDQEKGVELSDGTRIMCTDGRRLRI